MQDNLKDTTGELTGFPDKDRPWLKYYSINPESIVYPHETLYEFVWNNNKDHLEDIVFTYFDNKIKYSRFFENIKRAVGALNNMGIKAEDKVTIMSMHTPETIYAFYGLNYIGAVANMVYPTLSPKALKQALEITGSKALFVLDVFLEKIFNFVEGLDIPVVILHVDESMPGFVKTFYRLKNIKKVPKNAIDYKNFIGGSNETNNVEISGSADSVATVVYTSGTTGEPKGVCLTNDNINALAIQDYNGVMEFERGKTCLLILPPFIGFGITQIHIMIGAGIKSILHIMLEPENIIKMLFKYNPQVFLTGPAFIPAFLEHKDGNLKNVQYYIGGGGALSEQQIVEVNEKLHRCGSKAVYSNGYGMTEASSLLCASANNISKNASVGIPFIDTNVKIIDTDTGKELKCGEIGELWFSTPTLMKGYWDNNTERDEIIVTDKKGERWLRTGDLGTVDRDGFVFITGRIKRIFITRAKDGLACKVFPQHIEDVITAIQEVSECGVIVKEDAERMNVAIAFVVLREQQAGNSKLDENSVLRLIWERLKEELQEYMVPSEIYIVDRITATPGGKIDYRALENDYKINNLRETVSCRGI